MTKVIALATFSDGVISMAEGDVREIADATATAYATAGLVEEYVEPIVPTGSMNIETNDTFDVTEYAQVVVNVPTGGGDVAV